jgi:16S rRNA (uracil1498-N3)-methyltransferase
MRRISGEIDAQTGQVSLSPTEERHVRVIRLRPGENIEVMTSSGVLSCTVISFNPLKVTVGTARSVESRELPISSILLCPLLKRDNFEFALQKATELGVSFIVPYMSQRVIKRISPEEFEGRRERFTKIIVEAVEQSNRDQAPVLGQLVAFSQALQTKADFKLFAYEDQALQGKEIELPGLKPGMKVALLVGPEGGFSNKEAEQAVAAGYSPVSLGKRILRAETAIVYGLSVISYLGEKN